MNPKFETVEADPDSSFRCLHFQCDNLAEDHGWHYHPEYELTWVFRSRGIRFVADSIERYGDNDFVLLGPGVPHCWQNDPSPVPGQVPELVIVQFGMDFLGSAFFRSAETKRLGALLERARFGVRFPPSVLRRVQPLLRDLVAQHGLRRLLDLLELLSHLAGAESVLLASPAYRPGDDFSPATRDRIEAVRTYVRQNLDGEISQAHIARQLRMSPPAFSRFFRTATGRTFVSFVNLLRIQEACLLLAGSDGPVTGIAIDCGYNNISNFNRRFHQLKGMTPSEYRQRARAVALG